MSRRLQEYRRSGCLLRGRARPFDGVALMDGGVVNNSPISHAVALGADEIWVLPTGYACALPSVPRSAIGMGMHALTVLVQHRLASDVERDVAIHVVPPLCPVTIAPTDFSRTGELIDRSFSAASAWIAAGGSDRGEGQAELLLPHAHATSSIAERR